MLELALVAGACGVAGIGGYALATHIHSIANAAAQRVVTTVAGAVGSTATLQPTAPPPAPAPAAQVTPH